MIVQDMNGSDISVFVHEQGAMVEAMLRAPNQTTFDTAAQQIGLLVQADGQWVPAPGIDIFRIGKITKTPAQYDVNGIEIAAAVFFPEYHVNLKLGHSAVAKGLWKKWAISWSQAGTVETSHNTETGKSLNGITLIDPSSVSSPSSVWG
ncbi:hypothetical protein FAP39_07015 [Shimia litoralis]|uniref:Uncharacterized protein n=1 Tax=Shimia litoralis TaxID=420403 RepID=A0A4V6F1Y8_9RHOB|nr:hypothetical protein [Shimia litoralis]TKZ21171.1 hypothetical protein FAP39_07015 [Shimia litoralis]